MKTISKIATLAILSCLMGFIPRIQAEEVACPPELKSAIADYENSLIKKDPVLLARVLADDFKMATSTGRMIDKKTMIANLANNSTMYNAFESKDVRFRKFGDTIIETGHVKTVGVRRTDPIVENSIYTDVWVLEGGKGGRWRLASEHSSFIQPAQSNQTR